MGTSGMKMNRLTGQEVFKLQTLLQAEGTFRDWEHAVRALSAKMDRSITRFNIESAASNCGLPIENVVAAVVKRQASSALAENVKELQRRIEALERAMQRLASIDGSQEPFSLIS